MRVQVDAQMPPVAAEEDPLTEDSQGTLNRIVEMLAKQNEVVNDFVND